MWKTLLAAMLFAASFAGVARADDQADAKAILDAAIKAHGGEAALGKVVASSFKVRGSAHDDGKTPTVSMEWLFQGTDKMRLVQFDKDGTILTVVNGKNGWVKHGEQAPESLSERQAAVRRETIFILNCTSLFGALKSKELQLTAVAETLVAGRKAAGILISHDMNDPVTLYFDKETHLLVKFQRTFKDAVLDKDRTEEYLYSDYRNVQEINQPFKIEWLLDGQKQSETGFVEIKLYDKPLNEKLFSKP